MPSEKASEFVDFRLKPVIQNRWSYIRNLNDFINEIKNLINKPSNSILVTVDVVGLYPSIPHESGLKAIKAALENRERKSTPTTQLTFTCPKLTIETPEEGVKYVQS